MKIILSLCTAVLAISTVWSQPGPPPPPPLEGRVYLFSEPDFRGPVMILQAGETRSNLKFDRDEYGTRWNDRISSIRLEGPVVVEVFSNADFHGDRLEIRREVRDLTFIRRGESGVLNWNDCISSVRAIPIEPHHEHPSMHRESVEIDRIIRTAYRNYLQREPDEREFERYRRRFYEEGWSEEEFRAALRDSEEFRRRDVAAIVRRAYRAEFGRDPDQSGLDNYVRAMRERGWTEQELRSELRNSFEGREHAARLIIIAAYREVLGREPDREGMNFYIPKLRDQGWTEERLRDALRRSDEYRNRPHPGPDDEHHHEHH